MRAVRTKKLSTDEASSNYLIEYLRKNINIDDQDIPTILMYWNVHKIRKNQFFDSKKENAWCNIIVRGAIKLFFDEGDTYQVASLLTAGNCWIQNENSGEQENFRERTVEETIVISISKGHMQKLLLTYPAILPFYILQREREITNLQVRIRGLQVLSAYDRYAELNVNSPDVLLHFSLRDIANYLGIKSETLSRIRNPAFKYTG